MIAPWESTLASLRNRINQLTSHSSGRQTTCDFDPFYTGNSVACFTYSCAMACCIQHMLSLVQMYSTRKACRSVKNHGHPKFGRCSIFGKISVQSNPICLLLSRVGTPCPGTWFHKRDCPSSLLSIVNRVLRRETDAMLGTSSLQRRAQRRSKRGSLQVVQAALESRAKVRRVDVLGKY